MRATALSLAMLTAIGGIPGSIDAGHLVPPAVVDQRLAEAVAERARNTARIDELLRTEAAAEAAARLGVDIDGVRRAASRLSDAEQQDLLRRAAALGQDPLSGQLDPDIKQLLIILLIVVIVVTVLQAVD